MIKARLHGVRRLARRFFRSQNGGIAVWAAVAVPMVALLAIGATELTALQTDKARLQDAADAAALMGANQLSVGTSATAVEQVKAYALAAASEIAKRSTVTADAAVTEDGGALTVRLTSHRSSFFGNMLPPGGFTIAVDATAVQMTEGSALCVIALETATGNQISLRNNAKISAPGCRVHSNSNISVMNSSSIHAESTQAVGVASGTINPAALTGAKAVRDPFLSKPILIPECDGWEGTIEFTASKSLEPGVHCGDYIVDTGATVTLLPGEHYFTGLSGADGSGKLAVKGQGRLVGEDVVLYFSADSKLTVSDQGHVDLLGRKTGADAGMLIIAARDNNKQWVLSSKAIRRLEGVIYLPGQELTVKGGSSYTIGEESKWTIAIVKKLVLTDALSFVLNANFETSTVPLPANAARAAGTRLVN